MKHPFFIVTIVFFCGMVLGRFITLPALPLVIFIFSALFFHLYNLWRFKNRKSKLPASTLLFLCIGLIGIYNANRLTRFDQDCTHILNLLNSVEEQKIVGKLTASPDLREEYGRLTLSKVKVITNNSEINFPAKAQVHLKGKTLEHIKASPPKWGDEIIVWSKLNPPRFSKNPNSFAYGKYLKSLKIYGSLNPEYPLKIKINKNSSYSPVAIFFHSLDSFEKSAFQLLSKNVKPVNRDLIWSICFGQSYRLPDQTKRDFLICGYNHIFAVSGLHVTIIAWFIFTIMRGMQINRSSSAVITIGLLITYMAMVGFKPSVIRAVIIVSIYLYSFFINTKIDTLSSLSLALFLNILLFPQSINNPGFQLSYLAFFGITIFFKVPESFFKEKTKSFESKKQKENKFKSKTWKYLKRFFIDVIIVTICSQIFIIPILASSFHHVPFISSIGNILILPIVGLLLFLTFMFLAFSQFSSGLSEIISIPLQWNASFLKDTVQFISEIPFTSVSQTAWPIWLIAIYYLIWLVPFTIQQTNTPLDMPKRRAVFLIQITATYALLVWNPHIINQTPEDLKITFLDVGQGDCTLIQTRFNQTILVDSGRESRGFNTLLPFLESKGINAIDLAIITHDDEDHFGGMLALVGQIRIHNIILPDDPTTSKELKSLLLRFKSHGSTINYLSKTSEIRGIAELNLATLSPDPHFISDTEKSDNELSIVMQLNYHDFDLLLTGDIGKETETYLTKKRKLPDIDILKVSHHGSRHSSTDVFLRKIKPEFAIISCGYKNTHGHPATDTLNRLKQNKIEIFRTDLNGAILVQTDGTSVEFEVLNTINNELDIE